MKSSYEFMEDLKKILKKITIEINNEITKQVHGQHGVPIFHSQHRKWENEIHPKLDIKLLELSDLKPIYFSSDLNTLILTLLKIESKFKEVVVLFKTGSDQDSKLLETYLDELNSDIDSLNMYHNFKINNDLGEIKKYCMDIHNKIRERNHSYDVNYRIFNFLSNVDRSETFNEVMLDLVAIHNILVTTGNTDEMANIEKKINSTITLYEQIKQLKQTEEANLNILSEVKELKNQIDEKQRNLNENLTINNNEKLLKGFDTEVKLLEKKIVTLSRYIFILFLLIISLLGYKVCIVNQVLLNPQSANSHYLKEPIIWIAFLGFILSLTGFLTYFIKERARLIKLHDHFNLNRLELFALPEYMNEFDNAGRRELYKALAPNYFRGNYPSQNDNSEIKLNDEKFKLLTDMIKTLKPSETGK